MVVEKTYSEIAPSLLWAKRALDLAMALLVLLLTSPFWLLVALLIKATSAGPIFYYQRRIGLGGREFNMVKFRSMAVGADSTSLAGSLDPRITRVGRWLRNTSLDELPQLINVLRSEMSIVGPRPALPEMVPHYTENERRRLGSRPGLTGLAQVNGRNSLPYHKRLRLDAWYVEHWSLWLDLAILIRTIPVLVRGTGLSQDDPRPWEHRPRPRASR